MEERAGLVDYVMTKSFPDASHSKKCVSDPDKASVAHQIIAETSKRGTTRKRESIKHKVSEHRKQTKKQARKDKAAGKRALDWVSLPNPC